MRPSQSMMLVIVMTCVALLYVHQQIELVKLSYEIECKEKCLKEMLDRKEHLGYNVNNLEAPSRLEGVLLARNIDVALPKKAQIVQGRQKAIIAQNPAPIKSAAVERRSGMNKIFEFLGLGAEAHAKER